MKKKTFYLLLVDPFIAGYSKGLLCGAAYPAGAIFSTNDSRPGLTFEAIAKKYPNEWQEVELLIP